MVTQEEVKRLFEYLPDGNLLRKIDVSSKGRKGSFAGTTDARGYIVTTIVGKRYKNHRLVWLWHFGYLPENELDHINKVRHDNRIENLREISHSCNLRNAKQPKNNTSGVKGVSWYARDKKWKARITLRGRVRHLKTCKSLLEAACHRLAAEQCLDWSSCEATSPAAKFVRNSI